jgi:peptide/nickel transport system ATP-binding protein
MASGTFWTPKWGSSNEVVHVNDTLLDVRNLRTEFRTEHGTITPVNDVSFTLREGETLGIVGESGAGKSVTARSMMRLVQPPGEIVGGEVLFRGRDILQLSPREVADVRGKEIAMILQDPKEALNPVLTVGEQIVETIVRHQDEGRAEARRLAKQTMRDVGIPDVDARFDDYPHEFSGGMGQRVLIAIALSCEPALLIADEPTTALDVTTQANILDLLNDLQERKGLSLIVITHNLGVVSQTCDRVAVMYAGNVVEKATVEEAFRNPHHPYTRALLDAVPEIDRRRRLESLPGTMPDLARLPSGCNFADRCEYAREECRTGTNPPLDAVPGSDTRVACIRSDELDLGESGRDVDATAAESAGSTEAPVKLSVRNLRKYFKAGSLLDDLSIRRTDGGLPRPSLERNYVRAVEDVSFDIHEGETLGIVGESGCGKSTVANTLLRLTEPTDGEIHYEGTPLHDVDSRTLRSLRREMQIIFQTPQNSLNPRQTVGRIIGRPLELHDIATGTLKRERVRELLEQVGLGRDVADSYPHELSGGQQQRIAIARALAVEPDFLVCDEPVSALDVSVQAQIINLLEDLQDEFGLSYLFISHNLGVVRQICDRVGVMYLGRIVEIGPTEDIFSPPYHPYTESLLSAIPHTDPSRRSTQILLEGDVPSPLDPPSGCPFHTRCPKKIGSVCETDLPPNESVEPGSTHEIACHLTTEEMRESDLEFVESD